MTQAATIYERSTLWARIAICANVHLKEALLGVVHNRINDSTVKGIPSNQEDLFNFLQRKKHKIPKNLKAGCKQLLPSNTQRVDSSTFDITSLRLLIRLFCNIKNAKRGYDEPDPNDTTLFAYVYRAAELRNEIYHYGNIEAMDENTFGRLWLEMKKILNGLQYKIDVEPERTEMLEISLLRGELLKEFREHLENYKEEISKETSQDCYVQRRFSVHDKTTKDIVTDIAHLLNENDQLNIFADAGVGKSFTARKIKEDWSAGKILPDYHMLYFDSKQINDEKKCPSFAAALFFSELEQHLRRAGKTEKDFIYYECVRTTIDDLIILIDGIDEYPIKDLVKGNYIDDLEKKVINNEEISAADTINAIYFGFLFPHSKIILLGRNGEFKRLKELKMTNSIFNRKNRKIKELELLPFDDANIKDFTCFKICGTEQSGQKNCAGSCQDIHEKVKDIALSKIPTDLNSLLDLHERFTHQNENIGRITRTKLIIATLLNRLNDHIYQRNDFAIKTFKVIPKDKSNYLECISTLSEISFKALSDDIVTIKAEKNSINGVDYLEIVKNKIKIEHKTLEELDFFHVRDLDYNFVLEPRHALHIEFLSACYLLSRPEEWNLLLKLSKDRQLDIISFIAGLHADDAFTKDFVENVFHVNNSDLQNYFRWLYSVENIRERLPDGGDGYRFWYGLMEDQKLSPSFFLLESISNEIEIPPNFIPSTIICYCACDYLSPFFSFFEWYDMHFLKHTFLTKRSDDLNMEGFLDEFPNYNFIIKGDIKIENDEEFNLLNNCKMKNNLTFRINNLMIDTALDSKFKSSFDIITLHIGYKCNSYTIDMILNALSPYMNNDDGNDNGNDSDTNYNVGLNYHFDELIELYGPFFLNFFCYESLYPSPFTSFHTQTAIKCRQIYIDNIRAFNYRQTKNLFQISTAYVDFIALSSMFLTYEQINILNIVELSANKLINLQLNESFDDNVIHLPRLGNRQLAFFEIDHITNDDLIRFSQRIAPEHENNYRLDYKIICPTTPFVQKPGSSRDCKQLMYLHLCFVDFKNVLPELFARTFSSIPFLEFWDNDNIPSSYWLRLAEKDGKIDEIRIWHPQTKNVKYFLSINTRIILFVCRMKDDLKELLDNIVNSPYVQLDRGIKVFVVKFDLFNWDHYEEITLFRRKTLEEYRNNCSSDDLLLDNTSVPFYEGEKNLNWCCEISQAFEEKSNEVCGTDNKGDGNSSQ